MIYRFRFVEAVDMAEVEETVGLSLIAAGCLIGDAAVRLGATYLASEEKRSVVIQATGDAECVLRLFCGFCSHEYTEAGFSVERVDERPKEVASDPNGSATTRQSVPSGVGILTDTGDSCEVCGGSGSIPVPDAVAPGFNRGGTW